MKIIIQNNKIKQLKRDLNNQEDMERLKIHLKEIKYLLLQMIKEYIN